MAAQEAADLLAGLEVPQLLAVFAALNVEAQRIIDAAPEGDLEQEAFADVDSTTLLDFANGPVQEALNRKGYNGDPREALPADLKALLWPDEFCV